MSTEGPDGGAFAGSGDPSGPVRVAFLIDSVLEGGTAGSERQLLFLLRRLDRSLVSPSLTSLSASPWLRTQALGVPLRDLGLRRLGAPRTARLARAFGARLREERTQVLHTWFPDSDLFGALASRFSPGTRLVCSRRNLGHWQTPGYLRALRLVARCGTRYLANSRAAALRTRVVEGVAARRIAVIPNGLDLSRFRPGTRAEREACHRAWGLPAEAYVLGIVANLREVKNVASLLRAAARLSPRHGDLHVVSIGEGPLRADLESLATTLGIGAKVRFLGARADVAECLAGFDVGLLTSTHESLSNALMEYMACGLPVVASRVGGAGEVVEHGETGWLYEPHAEGALDACLGTLLEDRPAGRAAGRRGRERAEACFGEDAVLRAYERYYARVACRRDERPLPREVLA